MGAERTVDLECRTVLADADFVMRNHHVHGVPVLPGVTLRDVVFRMMIAAGRDHRRAVLGNVLFTEAIVTAEGRDREVRIVVHRPLDGIQPVTASSRWLRGGEPCSDWCDNLTAQLSYRDEPPQGPIDPEALRARAGRTRDMDELYARARGEGMTRRAVRVTPELGGGRRSLRVLWRRWWGSAGAAGG